MMNNIYRLGNEQCQHCFELGQRVHELEQHDLDAEDLRRYAWNLFSKVLWIGIWLALIGGGAAVGGLWIYQEIPSGYDIIVASTVWLFGAYIFINSILVAVRYYDEKNELINRLGELRSYRQAQIREINDKRREQRKKERERTSD